MPHTTTPTSPTGGSVGRRRPVGRVLAIAAAGGMIAITSACATTTTTAGQPADTPATVVTPSPVMPSPGRSQGPPKPAATQTDDPRIPSDYPDQPDVVPTQHQPKLPPVPMRRPASFGSGVSAAVVATTPVQVRAKGPGEVDGAGFRFSIELRNDSGADISLDEVTTALYLGRHRRPALPAGPNQNNPFAGSLADGRTRTATYVFIVPPGQRELARLEVSYSVDEPYVVFVGTVS